MSQRMMIVESKGRTRVMLDDRGWKTIGEIVDNGTVFIKKVHAHLHMQLVPPAWSNDREIINELHRRGVQEVHIYERDKGVMYTARIITILSKGVVSDRGHYNQIYLELEHWTCDKPPDEQLSQGRFEL